MKKVIAKILWVVNIISFALVGFFGASGIIYDLFGAGNYQRILEKLNIPWDYDSIWLFMHV